MKARVGSVRGRRSRVRLRVDRQEPGFVVPGSPADVVRDLGQHLQTLAEAHTINATWRQKGVKTNDGDKILNRRLQNRETSIDMKNNRNDYRQPGALGIFRATEAAAAKWRAVGHFVLLLAGTASFVSHCFAGTANTLIDDRYLIQDNGATVRDTRTGLTWMRCSVGQKWDGADCRGAPERLTLADAKKGITEGGDGAGHARWRLPTGGELAGLLLCIHSPEVVQKGCPETPAGAEVSEIAFPGIPDRAYWSSSTGDDGSLVSVLFDISGPMYGLSDPEDGMFVRLVEVGR